VRDRRPGLETDDVRPHALDGMVDDGLDEEVVGVEGLLRERSEDVCHSCPSSFGESVAVPDARLDK